MNVLALYSSPRRNSNSTFLLKEIMSAVKEKGVHTTTEFDVAKMNIKGCQACEGCHNPKGNGGCVVKDDMQQVQMCIRDRSKDWLFLFGGRRWIRTIEAESNRFTVCPLWPLGNPPIFIF